MFAMLIRKNLFQRPLRYVLTGLAIAFGVAAVTAVFVFTDGLRETFDGLAGDIESGFDIAVTSESPFGDGLSVPPVPLELLDSINSVDGVSSSQPRIIEFGVIAIDSEGEPRIGTGPNLGVNWEARTPTPRLFAIEGRAPEAEGEFAIDVDGFNGGAFVIGDTYTVLTPTGSENLELVGSFNFGSEDQNAAVGAVLLAFEEEYALNLLNAGRGYDDITVIVDDGADVDTVINAIQPVLDEAGTTFTAASQAELVEAAQDSFGQILGIFQTVLLVFAVIILLVSAFLIFNVFTITLGQRIKELGLLRSIGAFGSQVTNMMLGEALVLGIVATILGLPAGWLLANLLRFALSQLGFPGDTGLPIRPATILYAVIVGIVVTLLAALPPSIRARRVSPIAALRDGVSGDDLDSDPNVIGVAVGVIAGLGLIALGLIVGSWIAMLFLPVIGGVLLYLGVRSLGGGGQRAAKVVMLATGLVLLSIVRFAEFGVGPTFGLLGAGALLTIVGASLVSGLFAGPVSKLIGQPPLAVIVGLLGVLFAIAALGSIIGAVFIAAGGNLLGLGLIVLAPLCALGAYGLIRTAIGAFGLTGQLARDNAARNPSRTATTATALMIGLALVAAVTVIGDSIKTSVTSALGSSISADWFIQGPTNGGPQATPFSTEAAGIVEELPEVSLVVPYRFAFAGFAHLPGAQVDEIEAAVPRLFAALGDDSGGGLEEVRAELGADQIFIDDLLATDFATVFEHIDPQLIEQDTTIPVDQAIWIEKGIAEDRNLALGDPFVVAFLDGQAAELKVAAIYDNGFVLGNRVIDFSVWDQHLPKDTYGFISATTAPGVEEEDARSAIEAALEPGYPILEVANSEEVSADAEAQINQTLAVVNVLLLLSAVIAILGIAIALALSVFERTREIGLLRAVGTTRTQTRWVVRWEGVIVAAFGGLVGVIVGVGLGVLATQKMPEFLVNTTSLPIAQLVGYVIMAALTGLGAGAFPAWVAGRMNVLEAISHE